MASAYPTGLDTFATTRADATAMATTHKDDHNDANDAINKIEAELGINPSGAFSTVLAHLDAKVDIAGDTMTGPLGIQVEGGYGYLFMQSANGIPGAPTATALNDVLGNWSAAGYGATDWGADGSGFYAKAFEDFTDTAQGSGFIFYTTPIGSLEPTERWQIEPSGALFGERESINLSGSDNNGVKVYSESRGTISVSDRTNGFLAQMFDSAAVVNKTITGMSRSGTTVTVTATAHTFVDGDRIAIYGVTHTFNAEVNGAWTVANAAANTFDITVAGLSSGSYTSGGTTTNRAMYYGYAATVGPTVARGLLTGTAQHADDINGFVAYNAGTAKATDAYYIGRNTGIAGSEWTTAFTIDANADYGIRLNGTFVNYGIDFNSGTFTLGQIRLKNNVPVVARNAADSADLELFRVTTTNQLKFGAAGATTTQFEGPVVMAWSETYSDGVNIALGTSTGTKIGTATSQKLAFHNSTPVIQRAGAAQAAAATTGSTQTTPFGYTTAAQADAIVTLVNEIRATLVEKGLMKGAA